MQANQKNAEIHRIRNRSWLEQKRNDPVRYHLAVFNPETAIFVATLVIVTVTAVYQQEGEKYDVRIRHDVDKQGWDSPAQSKHDLCQVIKMPSETPPARG